VSVAAIAAEPPADAGSPPPVALAYRDAPGALAALVSRNTVMTVLTLGIYRFWARSRIRRHFWSRVEVDGSAFEYHGTGRELFLGFLLVTVLLVPIVTAVRLADFALLAYGEGAVVAKDVAFGVLLFFLYQYGTYRARRYQLTRTAWRGIRGGQTGKAGGYAVRALREALLVVLSLGLLYPRYRQRLYRLRMENTWLGSRPFAFDGGVGPLFARWLVAWLPIIVTLGLLALVVGEAYLAETEGAARATDGDVPPSPLAAAATVALWPALLFAACLYIWYRVAEFRYFAKTTIFGDVAFESDLRTRSFLWIYISYWLALLGLFLTIGAGLLIFALAAGGVDWADDPSALTRTSPAVFVVAGVLILIAFTVLNTMLLLRRKLKRICESLSLWGDPDVDGLRQTRLGAPRMGEGLADALDIGAV
jgi:uncharacterized membrane protein YjgN (DUF898 family)